MTNRRTCQPIQATIVAVGVLISHAVPGLADDLVRIAPNLHQPHGLAVSANGQNVVTIEGQGGAILAGDPAKGEPWRELVARASEDLPWPVAVGSLPGDVVAAVCRDGDAWTLRTFRIKPETAAEPNTPLQVVQFGKAAGDAGGVAVAVHPSRGWLVVAGLPSPLPPVVRCAIAGVRLGPPSDRACPTLPDRHRPVAVAVNADGDILLVLRPESGDDVLAIYDAAGHELLRLPAGLRRVAAIAVSRSDGLLWVVGTSPQGRTGLWRLDATLRDQRQAVKPVFAHPLAAPTAMVSASDRVIVVIDEDPQPIVLRIRPPALEASSSGRSSP